MSVGVVRWRQVGDEPGQQRIVELGSLTDAQVWAKLLVTKADIEPGSVSVNGEPVSAEEQP